MFIFKLVEKLDKDTIHFTPKLSKVGQLDSSQ